MEENKDAETVKKLWPALCIIICAAAGMILSSNLWGRSFNLMSLLITLGLGALGAIVGFISFRFGKKAKIASLIFCLLIFAGAIGYSKYMLSDSYIVKTDWPVHELEKISFAYPTELKERDLKGVLPENADVKVLTNENMNRYVACYTYDFFRDKPTLDACMENAVSSILTRYGAKTVIWDTDTTVVSKTLVKGRFTYTNKLRNKTLSHTGFAFGYAEGSHYELVMFFPLREQYSPDFMNKIEENIKVRD